MKKAFTLLFIAITFNSYSQDWSPFNLKEKFNYQSDTASIITASYFADSVKTINSDSVFYLNRIVFQYTDSIYDSALINQPQYWEREMVKKQNGNYQFKNPGNKSLLTLAVLNDSWVFDSVQNISATVISIDEEIIFSNSDSVKTILLSNGDSIKLSKHFGLTKFLPNDSALIFQNLVGINGRNIGELIPDFNSIFDFNVDDVFSFDYGAWSSFIHEGGYINERILDKHVYPDSIIYLIHVHRFYSAMGAPQNFIYDFDKKLKFEKKNYEWINSFSPHECFFSQNLYSEQYHDYGISLGGSIYDLNLAAGVNGRKMITTQLSGFYDYNSNDSLFIYAFFENGHFQFEYTDGIGLTFIQTDKLENGFDLVHRYLKLAGYIKGGEAYGIILNSETSQRQGVIIFPSLCSDKIFIQNIFSKSLVSVLDIFGRVRIKSEIFKDSSIDMSSLPTGIYFVQVENNSTVKSQKIIKQ